MRTGTKALKAAQFKVRQARKANGAAVRKAHFEQGGTLDMWIRPVILDQEGAKARLDRQACRGRVAAEWC